MNINQVKTWTLKEIESFVNSSNALEGWYHDFKGIALGDTERIRKIFCSFANTKGGFILYGVSNNFKIIGVNRDTELKTKVSRKINNGISPRIPIQNWDINEFRLPKQNKYLYLLYISPSSYFSKPHMTNQKVYVRGNGTCDPIEDGNTLRKLFLIEKFYPSHIHQLENELSKIKECCTLTPDTIDFMYLHQLRSYLENRLKDDVVFNELLNYLREIIKIYENIKNIISVGVIQGQSANVIDNKELSNLHSSLEILVNKFIRDFKNIHSL